jgi:hypothetical protein
MWYWLRSISWVATIQLESLKVSVPIFAGPVPGGHWEVGGEKSRDCPGQRFMRPERLLVAGVHSG